MADPQIKYRHLSERNLTTVYAVLWKDNAAVRVADGVLAVPASDDMVDFAIPLSDADRPYFYVGPVPDGTPYDTYELEIQITTTDGVYDVDDLLIGQGPYTLSRAAIDDVLPTSLQDLRDEVARFLGGSDVDVELTDADWGTILKSTIRILNRWRPQQGIGIVNYASGTRLYPVTDARIIGITDVAAVGPNYDADVPTCGCNLFNAFGMSASGYLMGPLNTAETYGERMLGMWYTALAAQSDGTDFDWTAASNPNGGINLFLSNAPWSSRVMYTYNWGITPDDNPVTGVSRIPEGDYDWVLDLAKAKAKQIVGLKRRKFGGGVNMPDGGTESLDGDALVQEGKQEEVDLIETIKRRTRPALPQG